MASLGELKPELETTVVVVLIANEENATFAGIGVDQLAKEGYMDDLKQEAKGARMKMHREM